MVGFVLRQGRFRVIGAGDAETGRRRVADQPPDLILMDWMLPGVSGVELTRELKADPLTGEIPVLMLTARGSTFTCCFPGQ